MLHLLVNMTSVARLALTLSLTAIQDTESAQQAASVVLTVKLSHNVNSERERLYISSQSTASITPFCFVNDTTKTGRRASMRCQIILYYRLDTYPVNSELASISFSSFSHSFASSSSPSVYYQSLQVC